jgi:ketosteroid isomerase-like protein
MAGAFAAGEVARTRDLYRTDVVYVSPTTRLFGWPARIEGVERTLEFIELTVRGLGRIDYVVQARALVPGGGAFVKVRFDFDMAQDRLRSTYVVLYRHDDDGRIARQELYYDPSGVLERLGDATT